MSNREEFEDALRRQRPQADIDWSPAHGEYTVPGIQRMWEGYQMRQPEIDVLKAEIDVLNKNVGKLAKQQYEIVSLKIEVARLRSMIKTEGE